MGFIAGHALSTFTSPVNATSPIDANVVKGNDNSIKTNFNAHDADASIHLQSAAVASRPAFGNVGASFMATDTGAVYIYSDTGTAWVEVNYLRNTGGTVTGAVTITSASATALAVGPNGTTTPIWQVDCSTVSAVAGLKLTGAVTTGTVALAVITDSGNANLTINAAAAGTIGIGSVSTGRVTITPATTITGALTLSSTITASSASAHTLGPITFTNGAIAGATTYAGSGTMTVTGAAGVQMAGLKVTGTTTAANWVEFDNTGNGSALVGIDNSTGTGLGVITGSSAYAVLLGTQNANAINFFTNGAVRASISSAGNFSVGGNFTVTPAGALSGITSLAMGGALSGVTTYSGSGKISVSTTAGATVFEAGSGDANTGYRATILWSNVNAQNAYFALEGSVAGTLFTNSHAYYPVIGSSGAGIDFATSGAVRWTMAVTTGGIYSTGATGTDKGSGTINVGTGIYLNGTAYTNPDYVFEHAYTGRIVKFADKVGAKDYAGLLPLSAVEDFTRTNYRLPLMAQMIERTNGGELFAGGDALLASVEQGYMYLFGHQKRLAAIEQRLGLSS